MLTVLDDHPDAGDPEPFAGPDHPIRKLTRAVAGGKEWTAAHAERMANLFDGMAADWSDANINPTKAAPVHDAFVRGGVPAAGSWLELGSGTGAGAQALAGAAGWSGRLTCADLSAAMLAEAPSLAPRVQADASRLPFASGRFDAVMMINMLLFPAEVDRVLARAGVVVWINTLGDQTPIHLPAADVVDALPGAWRGVTARAGTGFWLVARRA